MTTAQTAITMALRAVAAIGWLLLGAVDFHLVEFHLEVVQNSFLLCATVTVTIWSLRPFRPRRQDGDVRTYSQGVVDGMKLAAAEQPAQRLPHTGAKVIYLPVARAGDACTQGAPKPLRARSS